MLAKLMVCEDNAKKRLIRKESVFFMVFKFKLGVCFSKTSSHP